MSKIKMYMPLCKLCQGRNAFLKTAKHRYKQGTTTTILTRRARPMLNQNNNTERKEDPLPLDRPGLPDLPNQNT